MELYKDIIIKLKNKIKNTNIIVPAPRVRKNKIMKNFFKNTVIIAPHPDDETIGLGGTIKKLVKNK